MKKSSLIAIAIFIPSLLLFSSCSDSDMPKASDEILFSEVQDEVYSTTIEEEAFNIAEQAVKTFRTSGLSKTGSTEPIVNIKSESNNFPIDYELDFGNRYIDKKGNVYKGIINLTLISKNETELEFDKFFINDNPLKGNKKLSLLANGILSIVSDVKLTNKKTNQSKYRYTEQQRTVLVKNNSDNLNSVESYSITGFSVGNIYRNGKEFEYNFNIEQPLVFVSGSKSYIKGITIIRIGSSTQYVNYGVGEKEKIATWLFR